MLSDDRPQGVLVVVAMPEHLLHRKHRIPYVESYEVSEDELREIERGYSARRYDEFALTVAVTAFISFLVGISNLSAEATFTHQFFI